MTVEQNQFRVDPNIIYDIIRRQAGTLGKAILEGVMNSVDAEASVVHVTLDQDRFLITDDGSGMQNRDEIYEFFGKFGTPHEAGDARFGRFRIGRGQMMVYGVMDWRTGPFRMGVDLQNHGLDYTLEEMQDPVDGCAIEVALYNPLSNAEYVSAKNEIEQAVRYMVIPVYFNGEQINKLPQKEKWDYETERFWMRLNGSGQSVAFYNQGAFVRYKSFGVGGVVVTKPGYPLELNMARNDILEAEDTLYQEIADKLRSEARKLATKASERLDDTKRIAIFHELRSGQYKFPAPHSLEQQTRDYVRSLEGRGIAPKRLLNANWFFAPAAGDVISDKLSQRGDMVAIHPKVLEWAGIDVNPESFRTMGAEAERAVAERFIEVVFGQWWATEASEKFTPYIEAGAMIDSDYEDVPDKKLTKLERAQMKALEEGQNSIRKGFRRAAECDLIAPEYGDLALRQLRVGSSSVARAWTDGSSTIWINRSELKALNQGLAGVYQLAALLTHEYCHLTSSSGSHTHDMEFYETFHEVMQHTGAVAKAIEESLKSYLKTLDRRGLKIPRNVANHVDRCDDIEKHYIQEDLFEVA